jgi:putative spermidine/putrescine transport system permease protein
MTSPAATLASSRARRLANWLHARPQIQLALLLAAPLAWLGLAYLGSLLILLLNSIWQSDPFSGKIIHNFTLDSFARLFTVEVYRAIAIRTIGMAIAVTITCTLLAFPIAFYMARIASPRLRGILVVLVLVPLWASYLVKIYSWRIIFQGNGVVDWMLAPFGIEGPGLNSLVNSWLVFSYLWLPYMILPIYAGLERIPSSMLEASADLGARAGTTFRHVVLPLAIPAIAAGSIFTFSLTLGDYIVPDIVSNTKFIGNVIYDNAGLGSLPLAAAYAFVPVLVMILYLLLARRLGALESL